MEKVRFATVWLGGCSGCHMSFLDMDEYLLELAQKVDVVYTPIADIKEYPENVDVALVEGAVANEDNLHVIKKVRARTKILISLGDCAITGNVTSLRNPLGGPEEVLDRAYRDAADARPQIPYEPGIVPELLKKVVPVHAVVPVDAFIPGCPPDANRIRKSIEQLLDGAQVVLAGRSEMKFG